MYLSKENRAAAAAFINSPLWTEYRKALKDRFPPPPQPSDAVHTQAAQGFLRRGFEEALEQIEKLPFEVPTTPDNPFNRPALETAD